MIVPVEWLDVGCLPVHPVAMSKDGRRITRLSNANLDHYRCGVQTVSEQKGFMESVRYRTLVARRLLDPLGR
jgi:hypothetical protein